MICMRLLDRVLIRYREVAVLGLSLLLFSVLGASAALAQAPREIAAGKLKDKYALVIGNSAYPGRYALRNPAHDAEDIAASMRTIGFATTLVVDADLKAMRLAFAKFTAGLPAGAAAVVFYAGHGVQHAGQNYLLPVDSIGRIKQASDLELQSVRMSDVIAQLSTRGNAISILILDACRDSPFPAQSDIKSGLARSVPPGKPKPQKSQVNAAATGGTLIAYSTAPNATAADGADRNSPYSKVLKDALRQPNTPLEAILKATRTGVTIATEGAQTPWYESSINGDFYPAGHGRIDFVELVRSLMIPVVNSAGISATVGTWAVSESAYSPIKWLHDGIRPASTPKSYVYDLRGESLGPYVREGEVVITVDGEPTHYQYLKGKEPVKWRILMTGPRAGVTAVGIFNPIQSQELGSFAATSKILKEDPACRQGGASEGSTVYAIGLEGYRPAWFAAEWSCGSGGCSRGYWLLLAGSDRARFGCPAG